MEKINFNQYILEKSLANYNIGKLQHYEQLRGWFNSSFLTETENGRFVLKFFRPGIKIQEKIDFLFFLLSYLLKLGFPVNKIIAIREKCLSLEVKVLDKVMSVALFDFLQGEHKKYGEVRKVHLQKVGKMLKSLHEAFKQVPGEKLINFQSLQQNFQQELKRIEIQLQYNFSGNYFSLPKEKINFFEQVWKSDFKELSSLASSFNIQEEQLIHSDLTTDNVIFTNDEISGILDLDGVRMGLPLEDLAITTGLWFLNAVDLDARTCIGELVTNYKQNYLLDEWNFLMTVIRFYIWKQIAWAIGPPENDYFEEQHRISFKTFERKYKELSLLKHDDIFTN